MASGNMKDIKRRIKSVESTMQITKAMELVASSKLRKAKEKADKARPYFDALYETMCEIQAENPSFLSPFTRKVGEGKSLLVVIAGDRGLAGGFNSNVLKMAKAKADDVLSSGGQLRVMAVGKKAVEFFEKRDYDLVWKYPQIAENIDTDTVIDIVEDIIAGFRNGDYDKVELVYTTFVSALTQEPCSLQILPVEDLDKLGGKKHPSTIYDPSPEEVFDGMIPQYIGGMLYSAIVDSYASEQAARRTAMESATDNAGEMIDNLSLLYNRARQAQITQELTEISSATIGR